MNIFGFRKQLWPRRKIEVSNVTILKYVQFSEFSNTDYGVMQYDINANKEPKAKEYPKTKHAKNYVEKPTSNIHKEPLKPVGPQINNAEAKEMPKTPKLESDPIVVSTSTPKQVKPKKEAPVAPPRASSSSSAQNAPLEDEFQQKSTLIQMAKSNDLVEEFKVHAVHHDNRSIKSEDSYESAETLEAANCVNKEYSSQAASIFFAEDSDNDDMQNIKLDIASQASQTSA